MSRLKSLNDIENQIFKPAFMIADSRIKCMNLIRNKHTCGSRLEDFLNIPPNFAAMSWRKNDTLVSFYIIMASQKSQKQTN